MPNQNLARAALIFALAFLGGAEQDRSAGRTVKRPGHPDVTYVGDKDAKMNAAIVKARATVDQFIQALNRPQPSQSGFSVKMPIRDGKNVEHMWILPVRYADGRFFGKLDNKPDTLKNVKLGDDVSVVKDQVSDWMYIDNKKLVGGYSIRVLRDSLRTAERAKFDRSVPFRFE